MHEDIMPHFCNAIEALCQTGVPSDEEGRKALFVKVVEKVNKSMRGTGYGADLETRFSELRACSMAHHKFNHSFHDFTQTSFKKALATVHARNLKKNSGVTAKRARKKRLGAGKRHVGEPRMPTRAGQRGAKKRPTREPEPEPEE
jgi:hypothetical protein